MREHVPKPLFAPQNDDGTVGSAKTERTKEDLDKIEKTPIAAALIAEALSYGARMEDIGPLLAKHCPQLLADPSKPIQKGTIYGRVQRAHRLAGKTGDQQKNYVAYLKASLQQTPLPEEVTKGMHLAVRAYLREHMPPMYWMKDDECRALLLPLVSRLTAEGEDKIFAADLARVLSVHLDKEIDKTGIESFCKRNSPEDMLATITAEPAPLSKELMEWGKAESTRLFQATREAVKESRGRPSELDKNVQARALAAALLEKRRPVTAISTILGRRSVRASVSMFSELLKKHGDNEDPYKSAADEMAKGVSEQQREAERALADTMWEDHVRQSFLNRYLTAEIFQTPEKCALMSVLLDETELSPDSIVRLLNDRYKGKTNRNTLSRFVAKNGGRSEAATVLVMHLPAITPVMLEAARGEIPSLLARKEELEEDSAAEGQKKRLAAIAARERASAMEAQWLENPNIKRLMDDLRRAPVSRFEYTVAKLGITRRIDAQGSPVLAQGVTITLAKKSDMKSDESKAAHALVENFLTTLMTDANTKNENAISRLMNEQGYEYVQLRGYGEKRSQYGQWVYPIEVRQTIFK